MQVNVTVSPTGTIFKEAPVSSRIFAVGSSRRKEKMMPLNVAVVRPWR